MATARENALRNAGGDPNSPLFKQWEAQYGGGGGAAPQLTTLASEIPEGYVGAQIPDYLMGQTATNLNAALRGQLPADVVDFLRNQSAEGAVASGMPGGAAYQGSLPNYSSLRTLGLTSLDRMKDAENIVSRFFTSPLQAAEMAQKQQALDAGIRQQQAYNWNNQGPFTPPIASSGGYSGTPVGRTTPARSTPVPGQNYDPNLSPWGTGIRTIGATQNPWQPVSVYDFENSVQNWGDPVSYDNSLGNLSDWSLDTGGYDMFGDQSFYDNSLGSLDEWGLGA